MITTLAGIPVEIVGGNKKCLDGTRPFTVRKIESLESLIKLSNYTEYKLTKKQLIYDDEQELIDGLNRKKIGGPRNV